MDRWTDKGREERRDRFIENKIYLFMFIYREIYFEGTDSHNYGFWQI
jgi:hypothetical protein